MENAWCKSNGNILYLDGCNLLEEMLNLMCIYIYIYIYIYIFHY
jgi:hypothetical protein